MGGSGAHDDPAQVPDPTSAKDPATTATKDPIRERLGAYSALQWRILEGAAEAVKLGGVLVYATCTLTHAENEQVVHRFERRFLHCAHWPEGERKGTGQDQASSATIDTEGKGPTAEMTNEDEDEQQPHEQLEFEPAPLGEEGVGAVGGEVRAHLRALEAAGRVVAA